jgi:L-aminopeptidase/D-esterase-like protein
MTLTKHVGSVVALGLLVACSTGAAQAPPSSSNATLTAVPGLKVGHVTLRERPTGCTVIIAEKGVTAGVDVRGAAPGTRETDLLNPVNTVDQIFGLVLSGGSAFGLDTASGVMRFLEEKNIGFKVGLWQEQHGAIDIPIVPAAILLDNGVGDNPKIRPDADCGYRAAVAASTAPVAEGNVGAGAGATIGKTAGIKRAMKGGLGSAALITSDGLIVAAMVAINAAGDVIDPSTGRVVAGVRTEDGKALADARRLLRAGTSPQIAAGANTTLGVVATNATLTKAQATKVAQMAHDGFARAISPAHTPGDGDTIFALASGVRTNAADVNRVGALAAEVTADAILRAVRQAKGIPGYPAAADLAGR